MTRSDGLIIAIMIVIALPLGGIIGATAFHLYVEKEYNLIRKDPSAAMTAKK